MDKDNGRGRDRSKVMESNRIEKVVEVEVGLGTRVRGM